MQSLAYSKGYTYYILLTYDIILLFQNLLYPSMTCDYVTCNKMCDIVSHNVTFCNITFTSNLKLKEIKIKIKIKIKWSLLFTTLTLYR